ncbi:MAG: NUDIX domain-containing protein [Planctomycetota bacterium]|jgi:putative nucleotidyltransferase with HDIG domain
MPEIRACGFVLYFSGPDGLRYLILTNAKHGDVGLPKGRCKKKESDLECALRETEEETGLAVTPGPFFQRTSRYPVKKGEKTVHYFLASADKTDVQLSKEHSKYRWLSLEQARVAILHDELREIVQDAAVYLKDPVLRAGLAPTGAKELLVQHVGADAPVVAHSAEVAAIARTLSMSWADTDPLYVEACAWVHDIGRARTHDHRHGLAGFRMLCELGFPGYAPPCISHYLKGSAPESRGLDPEFTADLRAACDLDTFPVEERLIALADYLVAGSRRVPIEERHADLQARYGASPFIDTNRDIALALKAEWESHTGRDLYATAL